MKLKEKFCRETKSGELDHAFDQHIPLPDTIEEFLHLREIQGGCYLETTTLTNCPESLDDTSATEITLIQSVVSSKVINVEAAVRNGSQILINIEGGPACEVVGLSENRSCASSDGFDSQGRAFLAVQHSSSFSLAVGNSLNPEFTRADRRTGCVGEETVGPLPLWRPTCQHLGDGATEINTNNSNNVADSPDLEPQILDALLRHDAIPTYREVKTLTNLIIQSAQLSVEPTLLPQGKAEQVGLASAQPLQYEVQPSTSVSHTPHEGTHPDQSQPSHQPEATAFYRVQSTQLFPEASVMCNHPPVGDDPLKNELHSLSLCINSLKKSHELKQSQLRLECNLEIEKIKRKYGLLLQEQDSTHLQQRKILDGLYEKVLLNHSLAEDFRTKFISTSAAQGIEYIQSYLIAQLPQGEAEQAGLASAQPWQSEIQPSTSVSHTPLERTHPDHSRPSPQPEAAAFCPAQSTQLFPVASMMFNHPPVGDDPLKNELHRLKLHIDSLRKIHELKQPKIQMECNQEIEKTKMKYDLLLQEQNSTHFQQSKILDGLYEKVLLNLSLSEDFRAKFMSTSAAQSLYI